jgi:hypothetical protein
LIALRLSCRARPANSHRRRHPNGGRRRNKNHSANESAPTHCNGNTYGAMCRKAIPNAEEPRSGNDAICGRSQETKVV